MGKKSKSKTKPKERKAAGIKVNTKGNEIPRLKLHGPEGVKIWSERVDGLNPVLMVDSGKTWICLDDDVYVSPGGLSFERNEVASALIGGNAANLLPDEGTRHQIDSPTTCPVCLEPASKRCTKCASVYYCSVSCQRAHWKRSHKKACRPNPYPSLYQFDVGISQFRSLPANAFEGHEFLVINPTEKLPSLKSICEECLESADDIFDSVPGFGKDQLDPLWTYQNNMTHPVAKSLQNHFGWTSGIHGVEVMTGYRLAEDHVVYRVMFDDDFLSRRDLDASYYGDACFDWVRENRHVRGKIVIFKQMLTKKQREPVQAPPEARITIAVADDADICFDYELYPVTKAEVAHILQERMTAIEQGKYTRRQWRSKIRQEELMAESGFSL
mmetsp:Transcript_35229/g.77131  ORF Transcript_35229/g.77131 Transcript_35229/m.77131 type:complete len:385 (-) Transcript_35229:91-1245(-)